MMLKWSPDLLTMTFLLAETKCHKKSNLRKSLFSFMVPDDTCSMVEKAQRKE